MFDHYYVGDFENTTGGNSTYVYGAGFMNLYETDPHIFNNIDDAMNYLSKLPKRSCVYFHNFANYDGWIIVDWLEKHGFKFTTDKNIRNRYTGIITDDRQIYQLKIHFKNTVEFRDTCKLVAGKLDKIGKDFKCPTAKLVGSIDYDKPRGVGYVMTQQEEDYLKHDVLLLREILEKILTMDGLAGFLTAGSYAFNELKDSLYQFAHGLSDDDMIIKRGTKYYRQDLQDTYRAFFPVMPESLDRTFRKAYRGGYCINWSDGNIYDGHGLVLDFNSLYPSVMVNKPYPFRHPVYHDANYGIPDCDCYFIHILTRFTLKPGHLPFIQIKGSPFYVENEYIKDVYDEIDLWLTSVDFRLFLDMYDIQYLEVLESYTFGARSDLFNNFVTKHYEGKKNATDKTTRQAHKIVLNSSYGKFGTRTDRKKGVPYLNDDNVLSVAFVDSDLDNNNITYIPVACFVTAYGREKTIRSAMKVIEHLRYIDTDSLHLVDITLDEVKQIFDIDDKELGFLACESEFDKARWVRQKTYIERNIVVDGVTLQNPQLSIKACGLTEDGKQMLYNRPTVFDDFTVGLCLEDSRLVKHTVDGGVNLHRVDFNIR